GAHGRARPPLRGPTYEIRNRRRTPNGRHRSERGTRSGRDGVVGVERAQRVGLRFVDRDAGGDLARAACSISGARGEAVRSLAIHGRVVSRHAWLVRHVVGVAVAVAVVSMVPSIAAATPSWTFDASPNHGTGDNELKAVWCTSSTACVAVGDVGRGA